MDTIGTSSSHICLFFISRHIISFLRPYISFWSMSVQFCSTPLTPLPSNYHTTTSSISCATVGLLRRGPTKIHPFPSLKSSSKIFPAALVRLAALKTVPQLLGQLSKGRDGVACRLLDRGNIFGAMLGHFRKQRFSAEASIRSLLPRVAFSMNTQRLAGSQWRYLAIGILSPKVE